MRILFYPWLIAMLLPFAFAFLVKQDWKRRPLYIVVGLLIAWAVAWAFLLFTAVLEPLYKRLDIGLGSPPVPAGGMLPLGFWINLGLAYVVNFGVTAWGLKALLPHFKASNAR